MSRRPKPSFLRAVTGNPGHRPINNAEPVSTVGIGPPPSTFTDAQRFVWLDMVNCAAPGQLTQVDRSVLTMYCESKVRHDGAKEKVDTHGAVVASPKKGVPQYSLFYSIMRSELKTMQWCLVEMGYTPSSRSRVSTAHKRQGKAATAFDDLKDHPL